MKRLVATTALALLIAGAAHVQSMSGPGAGGSGTVTSVAAGAGLTGGTITGSGTIALATPTTSQIGGVEAIAAVSHEWMTSISTSGVPALSQPACGDLSNGGTACEASTGTSGATVPLLNAANTWSATQTFAAGDLLQFAGSSGYTACLTVSSGGTVSLSAVNGSANCSVGSTSYFETGLLQLAGSTATANGINLSTGLTSALGWNADTILCRAASGQLDVGTSTSTCSAAGTLGLGSIKFGSNLFATESTLPTVTSGLGTSPTVKATSSNGALITVGSTGTPSTAIVLGMATAADGWACTLTNETSGLAIPESANTTTSVSFTAGTAPANSAVLVLVCFPV